MILTIMSKKQDIHVRVGVHDLGDLKVQIMRRKVYIVMVNNSANINKTNNRLSPTTSPPPPPNK